jgi:hypothetical protein
MTSQQQNQLNNGFAALVAAACTFLYARYTFAVTMLGLVNAGVSVDELARSLHWSRTTVYAWIAVAQRWNAVQFRALVARRRLSWSHYVLLAAIDSASLRNRLINQTITNGWTWRQLRVAIFGTPAAAPVAPVVPTLAPMHPSVTPNMHITVLEARVDALQLQLMHAVARITALETRTAVLETQARPVAVNPAHPASATTAPRRPSRSRRQGSPPAAAHP